MYKEDRKRTEAVGNSYDETGIAWQFPKNPLIF